MRTKSRFLAALVVGAAGLWTTRADAAGFLWIAAPTWSYSAAAAATPGGGSWYFWGLSVGAGSYSYAYAFSVSSAPPGSAYAFAEARAGFGGMGGASAAGFADPYAGVGIDTTLLDPSSPSGYPSSEPSDPFSSSYTVNSSGITFTGSGEELNGVDELEAFTLSDEPTLDGDSTGDETSALDGYLGDPGAGTGPGSSSNSDSGDVTSLSALESDFGADLVSLDSPIMDPGSLTGLSFDMSVNPADVVLVAEGDAESDVPEPASLSVLALGGLGLLHRRRRTAS